MCHPVQCFAVIVTADIVTFIYQEIEISSEKSPDNATISYCDTFAIPRQCHNIGEVLYSEDRDRLFIPDFALQYSNPRLQ